MAMKFHTITITGRGAFPVDMLRYDCCFPASEHDSYAILHTFQKHEDWSIRLSKYSDSSEPWTLARWSSFNCYKAFLQR